MSYQSFIKIFVEVNGENSEKFFTEENFKKYCAFYGAISIADAYSIAREFKYKNERSLI